MTILSYTYLGAETTTNMPLSVVSIILNGLAYPVIVLALLTLKDNLTVLPEAHTVVKGGIYKITRHPLYFSYILWIVSSILLYTNLTVTLVGFCMIAVFILRAKLEEKVLIKAFDEDYKEYKTEVDFIPGLKWL